MGSSHSRFSDSAMIGLSAFCFLGTSPVSLPLLLLILLSQSLGGFAFRPQAFGRFKDGSEFLLLRLPPIAFPRDSVLPFRRFRFSTVNPTFSPIRALLKILTLLRSAPSSRWVSLLYCEIAESRERSVTFSRLDLCDPSSEPCCVFSLFSG